MFTQIKSQINYILGRGCVTCGMTYNEKNLNQNSVNKLYVSISNKQCGCKILMTISDLQSAKTMAFRSCVRVCMFASSKKYRHTPKRYRMK